MAWAIASGIEDNGSTGKERQYQQEQARIDLALLQFKSDAAAGKITWEEAQTRTDQWVKNNHSRLQKQAALAAELDQLVPLVDEPGGKANRPESPLPPGTPQAARFQILEQQEALAIAKIPEKTTPEERQHLTDVWIHSKEGAEILQEKQQLLAAESQRRAALPPPAPPPPPPGASPAKIARESIEIRRHALLLEVYAREPNATPEKRQILVDQEREKFAAFDAEIATLQVQLVQEDIAAETAALTSILSGQTPAVADPTPVTPKK